VPFYLLIFFSALNHSAFIGSRVTVSLYAIHLHGTPFTVGTLIALFGLLPMLLSLTVGRLIDRVGARTPMLAGSLMVAAGILLPSLIPGMATLYASCPLIGLGFIVCHLPVQHMIGFIGTAEDRPANFSHLATAFAVSSFAGPMLAGLSIDWLGYDTSFAILALLPLATAAAIATNVLKLPPHRKPSQHAGKARLADLLGHRELRSVFFITGLHSIAWELFSFMTPIYGSQIGLSASAIGVLMASFATASFTVRLALPFLTRRVTPWRLLRDTMLLAAAAYAVFPFMTQIAILMTVAFMLGMTLGGSQPMVMALLHDAAPEGRTGEAVGVRATIVTAGQTSLPLLFGVVGSALGVTAAYLSVALALALGSRMVRKRRTS
jgi:predicted MFS family arabinose efflux permease